MVRPGVHQESKGVLLTGNKSRRWFWGLILWMLHVGRARKPGPRCPPSDELVVECANVQGWVANGDFALESQAGFLAVVEHQLIPARARSVSSDLRISSMASSVWALAYSVPGGHAGVGVVSLRGAPLTLPTFCTPEFQSFFRLGRPLGVRLPLGNGRVAHLFVVYGYQGADADPRKFALTNKLMEAVIGEAEACETGQLVIIAGDLNAEPWVIPVTAKPLTIHQQKKTARCYSFWS